MEIATDSVVASLERSARARFVRWNAPLWRQILDGPAVALSDGLNRRRIPHEEADRVLENYLRLACEGIGLGLLLPRRIGAENFLSRAWMDLLPRLLPDVAADRRSELMAMCWNLGENLEAEPAWLQRILLTRLQGLQSLSDLEVQVSALSQGVLSPPDAELGTRLRTHWIALAADDRRFLPGRMQFVAPAVLCVFDRLRPGVAVGVWLADPPVPLGPMADPGPPHPAEAQPSPDWPWPSVKKEDKRLTGLFETVRNPWRAAATLTTSQHLVAILPESRK